MNKFFIFLGLYSSIIFADPKLIKDPFFYEAVISGKPSVFLLGIVHTKGIELSFFPEELWKLLTSSQVVFSEAQMALDIVPKMMRKPLSHSMKDLLDFKIIELMKSKSLNIITLDNREEYNAALPYMNLMLKHLYPSSRDLFSKKRNQAKKDRREEYFRQAYIQGDAEQVISLSVSDNYEVPTIDNKSFTLSLQEASPRYKALIELFDEGSLQKRNQTWLRKIIEEFNRSDRPISVVAGVIHFLEEYPGSLFHLLTENGFEVKRLSLEDIKEKAELLK